MTITTVAEMREMDRLAIENYAIPAEILMENAGAAAASIISQTMQVDGKRFLVLCGGGNNGGDGLVIARRLHSLGGYPVICLLSDPEGYRDAAALNYMIVRKMGLEVLDRIPVSRVAELATECDAIVDAIFGTGLSRSVEGTYKEIIGIVNRCGRPVYSADIPSGVNGNSGAVMGAAVKADYTITFGAPKPGNFFLPGGELGGELFLTRISFPPPLYDREDIKVRVNVPLAIPPRDPGGYKGSFGDVLFIAGASGYYGAPYLSAMSFLKSGGGYSRLASTKSVVDVIAGGGSEIVFLPMQETTAGSLAEANADILLEAAEKTDMVVIGPGLSLDGETCRLILLLLAKIRKPVLLDGDGLSALASNVDIGIHREAPLILTPHLGEMSRLSGVSREEIAKDQIGTVQRETGRLGAIIVLKGARTLVGFPDGRVYINLSGNSGMATAGSGDVLAGTIAGMFGLGLDLENAVRTGVFIHGFAGDLCAEEKGQDGMTAGDLMGALPAAVSVFREEYKKLTEGPYTGPPVIG
jgi:ADP-dependent NAD(P)H-hydrate dehydratase / NAD(P)H-hydrate epimerase